MENIHQFREAIQSAGLIPPDQIEPGKLHRFPGIGKRNGNTAAWCKLFDDGLGGVYGDYSQDISAHWQAERSAPITQAQREAFFRKVQESKEQAEAEKQTKQFEAAKKAAAIWQAAQPATDDHPYLARKGIPAHGAKLHNGALVIPMREGAELHSLQFIRADGTKRFLTDGRKKGRYFSIGTPKGATTMCIAEGFATGATIHEATGLPVAVAFDAGNLEAVAVVLRAKLPDLSLILCADDDAGTEGNPGVTKATAAAQAVGAKLAIPDFGENRPEGATDFNDMAAHCGKDAVQRAIANAGVPARGEHQPDDGNVPAGDSDAAEGECDPIDRARRIVAEVIERAKDDPNAHLKTEVIAAFRTIQENDPLEFESARTDLKRANRLVRMGFLDDVVRGDSGQADASIATKIADLAGDRCALWHDADQTAYATLTRESDETSHMEHWAVDSSGYREWLGWLAHNELGAAPASEVLKAAQNTLAGKAKFDGPEAAPARRVARNESGYWIDLCDDKWRAILVTATGWRIMVQPEPRFIRSKSMRPLPVPVKGGSIDALWKLCNIPENERHLVMAWILESYRPDTPYPVLELIGEQGSAKSTTQSTLRTFIDPNKAMLRGRPKSVEDLFVSAGNSHIVSLENLSGITADLSDALCTIATGGGMAGRLLYTNSEESVTEVHNPVILNGIGAVITRPDLLDRAIALCLQTINDNRMTEGEHKAALQVEAGSIFGGILDLFSRTLAKLPSVTIDPASRPRMADFAMLGEAMHQAAGHEAGSFVASYQSHRQDAIRRTIDSNPVATACLAFIEKGHSFKGTVKGLLELLDRYAPPIERADYWPKSPKGLADALRRVAPALRQMGIQASVNSRPKRDGVHCELRAGGDTSFSESSNNSKPSSPSSHSSPIHGREEISI